ncbi:hypothetical protein [Niastella sp. OAS944]|uniref:hypothetical protein n=1 Tax=Niastella sp. OAS944 TaxID=2664089 RepID=UPI003499986D|nr:hypothetical protein [Chitinophagaceae bacterium OAS944]
MRKFKVFCIMAAIAIAICGAFATKPIRACADQQQYLKWGSTYIAVGSYGSSYHCVSDIGICTYYRPYPEEPNTYIPCRTGSFAFGPE